MALWNRHRLADYAEAEQERLLAEDGWLRSHLVRHPGRRSGRPGSPSCSCASRASCETFGEAPWFPRAAGRAAPPVERLPRVRGRVGEGGVEDVHWAVQHELVRQLPLRISAGSSGMEETLELLREHVRRDRWPAAVPRENRTPLSARRPHAYDEAAEAVLTSATRPTSRPYGYDAGGVPRRRRRAQAGVGEQVSPLLPILRSHAADNVRSSSCSAALGGLLKRVASAEEDSPSATSSASAYPRRDDEEPRGRAPTSTCAGAGPTGPRPGFTARAAPQERGAHRCRTRCRRCCAPSSTIVIVDNGSTDGTPAVARRSRASAGAADRLEVIDYPFSRLPLRRRAPRHARRLGPQPRLLLQLVLLRTCAPRTRSSGTATWCSPTTRCAIFRDLAWQLEAAPRPLIRVPRYALYL